MSMYLVAGVGAPTHPAAADRHLPRARIRSYPSDTTDKEWALLAPLVPSGRPGEQGGRPAQHPRRDIVDAIRYVAHNGGVWPALPSDLPPWKTVYGYHARWTREGTVSRIHNALREQVRTPGAVRPRFGGDGELWPGSCRRGAGSRRGGSPWPHRALRSTRSDSCGG